MDLQGTEFSSVRVSASQHARALLTNRTKLYLLPRKGSWLKYSENPNQGSHHIGHIGKPLHVCSLKVLTGLQGSTAASRIPCAPLNPAGGGGRQLAGATIGARRSHASNTAAAPGPVFKKLRIWHNEIFCTGPMHTFLLLDLEQSLANDPSQLLGTAHFFKN